MTDSVLSRYVVPLVAGAMLAAPAGAAIYGGNPTMTLLVDRPEGDLVEGQVVLDTVRLHLCAGGVASWRPQETIDPVLGWTMALPAGDHCSVELVWDGPMTLEGSAYTLEYEQTTTTVPLTGTTQAVDLVPFDVVDGVIYGGNPSLSLTIQ